MSRPLLATIDPQAFSANVQAARTRAGGAKLLAVVKANAYGHGLSFVMPGLAEADGLALLELNAAVHLRAQGYSRMILLLEGCFAASELTEIAACNLALVVHQTGQLDWIEGYTGKLDQPFDIFIKVNTGMNRLGFMPNQVEDAVNRLESSRNARLVCLMMHFARTDDPEGIAEAISRFDRACASWPRNRYARSLSNSAALLRQGSLGGSYVRPGIMLYGASPYAAKSGIELGLRPVMSLTSELIAVQQLEPGEHVGYGAAFTATTSMRVGVVACGYADGYPRCAPNGTPVLVCGQRVPMAGRVSMDMITVDLTNVPQAGLGSPVELWGSALSVDDVARVCGTIGYELLCAVSPRVTKRMAESGLEFNGTGLGVEACI